MKQKVSSKLRDAHDIFGQNRFLTNAVLKIGKTDTMIPTSAQQYNQL